MEIQTDVCLASYTTLKVGGVAKYLVEVRSVEELQQVRQFAQQIAAPVLVLGGGSNILISDAGFAGVVIHNCISGVSFAERSGDEVRVTVGAGESLDELVVTTVERGYWGLENLSHIPGTVGAAPIQNVGAYGVEVASLIESVEAVSLTTGEVWTFTNAECEFAYRDSYFKTPVGRDWMITQVTFVLSTNRAPQLQYGDLATLDPDTCTLQSVRAKVIEIRSGKFPDWYTVGTAGSFFTNPIISATDRDRLLALYPALPTYLMPDGQYKVALGWVLDKICGLRGHTVGAVGLYEAQALVLVNTGDSASAIAAFAADIQSIVREQTGIEIEPEVRFV